MKSKSDLAVIDINAVQSRLLTVRDQQVLLDRDVAALYGVETRAVNQAVKNNHGKFPDGYVFQLDGDEFECLKSKILISNNAHGRGGVRKLPMAFTEKGLYMLATILKGGRAVHTTLSIIEAYAQVRELKRELVALHTESDKKKRASLMSHFGDMLTDIVMPDLDVSETESSLELNFFIGKLKHTVRRVRRAGEGK